VLFERTHRPIPNPAKPSTIITLNPPPTPPTPRYIDYLNGVIDHDSQLLANSRPQLAALEAASKAEAAHAGGKRDAAGKKSGGGSGGGGKAPKGLGLGAAMGLGGAGGSSGGGAAAAAAAAAAAEDSRQSSFQQRPPPSRPSRSGAQAVCGADTYAGGPVGIRGALAPSPAVQHPCGAV